MFKGMEKFFGLLILMVGLFSLSSCAFADMTDKAALGGQDSSNNYSWRIDLNNNLIPGTTAQNNIGDSTHYVNSIYAVSLNVSGVIVNSGAVTNSSTVQNNGAVTNASTVTGPGSGFGIYNLRTRVTLAQLNAGYTFLPAVTGRKYRLVNLKMISIGASMAATANATGIAVSATQSASVVALYTVNLAQLTRSTINTLGTASTVVLADGASFIDNDSATAVTVKAVGGTDLITATGVDLDITYAIE